MFVVIHISNDITLNIMEAVDVKVKGSKCNISYKKLPMLFEYRPELAVDRLSFVAYILLYFVNFCPLL